MAIDKNDTEEENQPQHVLGSELRDTIAATITRVLPSAQFNKVSRLVGEVEMQLGYWKELQDGEGK